MQRTTIIIFFILNLFTIGCSKNEKFDSIKWKGWSESEKNFDLRWKMSKDLIKSYRLKGLTKDSIINLLGKPMSKQNNKCQYFLGHTGEGINTGTLIIFFNKNGTVEKIKLTQG